jgi:hypothetical protein
MSAATKTWSADRPNRRLRVKEATTRVVVGADVHRPETLVVGATAT